MKKLTIIALLFTSLLTGCFTSSNLSITTAKPYEGKYSFGDKIVINETNVVDIAKGEHVWILKSTTLYNIIISASDKKGNLKITDVKNASVSRNEINNFADDPKCSISLFGEDDFADENYIWEDWKVSTNKIEALHE